MLEDELTKAMVDVGKDVASDIVRPTSKSIGDNLGLLVDGVMGWLGYWGQKQAIKREVYLDDYKNKIKEKVSAIPAEKLQEPEIRIVGPAVEASKFYIEEEGFREMFSQLISSSCSTEKASSVHPAFIEIIKQLSPLDAKTIQYLNEVRTFPCVEIKAKNKSGTVTPCQYLLFNFDKKPDVFSPPEEMDLTKTIDNLIRLGLVHKNSEVIELGYDYETFKKHWLYVSFEKIAEADSQMIMKKSRIELTIFGQAFAKCCL